MIGAAKKAELALRDARIAKAYKAGETQAAIAEREGVAPSLISIILKKQNARLSEQESRQRWLCAGRSPFARGKAAQSNERDLSERFFSKVKDASNPDKCWEWTGTVSGSGRPQIIWKRKTRQATHIALLLHGRPRKDDLFALHRCDNPMCVNPDHLWWGTQKENIRDALAKGRLDLSGLALAPQLKATRDPIKGGAVIVEVE